MRMASRAFSLKRLQLYTSQGNAQHYFMKRSIYLIFALAVLAVVLCCIWLPRAHAQGTSQSPTAPQESAGDQQQRVQSYNDLVQKQHELERQQEDRAKRVDELLVRQERLMDKQEAAFVRFEKVLDTWEQQQKQYQKYLDSLRK
jgi:hypothetical protein